MWSGSLELSASSGGCCAWSVGVFRVFGIGLVAEGASDETAVLELGAGREDDRGCVEESSNGSWATV